MRLVVLICTLAACGFTPTQLGGHGVDATGSNDGAPLVNDGRPLDTPVAQSWQVIDTLTVPCTQTPVLSTVALTTTGMYRLRSSSSCEANTLGLLSDAEYLYNVGSPDDGQSGVDNGIAIDDTNPGPNKTPATWGAYTATHVYEVPFTGKNAQITAEYWDANYPNNSGSLTLEIFEYK